MSAYGSHMNAQLLGACAPLDEAQLREDRGAFFGSIYKTLEHILFGDLVWMSRFVGQDFRGGLAAGDTVCGSMLELGQWRTEFDAFITQWASGVEQSWLDGELSWTSGGDGRERTARTALLVVHMFNHGTHHRGQLTALMSQAGLDVGVTDLPWIEPVRALASRA